MIPPVDLPEPLEALLTRMDSDHQAGRPPWVTLSYAQSLDGSIAARRGSSMVLSGPASLKITHQLRARHQAILIGIGTLLADDPRLNVRLVPGVNPQPVILDNQLRFPLDARILQGQKTPWVMTSRQASFEREYALQLAGVRVFRPTTEEVNIGTMLSMLGREGIRSVMVEGGARVITSFLHAQKVDLTVLTIAPLLVGGLSAIESSLAENTSQLDEFDVLHLETDLLVWGRPHWVGKS